MLRINGDRRRAQSKRPGLQEARPDRLIELVFVENFLSGDRVEFGYVRTGQADEEQQNEGGQKAGQNEQDIAFVHGVEMHVERPAERANGFQFEAIGGWKLILPFASVVIVRR